MVFKILLALLFLVPGVQAIKIEGCDFDEDGQDDRVVVRRCKKPKFDPTQKYCSKVVVSLSSIEGDRQVIKLWKKKRRARRWYTGFSCQQNKRNGQELLTGFNRRGKLNKIRDIVRDPEDVQGLGKVCKSVRDIKSCEVWKARASHDIPYTDSRKRSTTFIGRRGCGTRVSSCIPVYDSNGEEIHSLGNYPNRISDYDFRAYGGYACGDGMSSSGLASLARRNTGSSEVFLKDSSGNCIRIPDPSRCYYSTEC